MMNVDMKTMMSLLCTVGAAIVCVAMVLFGVISQSIPVLLWFAFAGFAFANVVLNIEKTSICENRMF